MARDPAFLFYSDHFLMGCSDLTMQERGQYITLLCIQHQKGFLTRKSIGLCLGLSWDDVSEDLKSKFTENEDGEISNERLSLEIEKRKNFSRKQSENGKLGGRPPKNSKPKDDLSEKKETQNKPKPKAKKKPEETLLVNVNVNENIDEIIIEKKESDLISEKINKLVDPDLEMPDEFKPLWADWIEYRKAKKKKPYAAAKFEQLAVNKFLKHSENDIQKGKLILEYTFYRNYEGFFPYQDIKPKITEMIKEQNNGEIETNR